MRFFLGIILAIGLILATIFSVGAIKGCAKDREKKGVEKLLHDFRRAQEGYRVAQASGKGAEKAKKKAEKLGKKLKDKGIDPNLSLEGLTQFGKDTVKKLEPLAKEGARELAKANPMTGNRLANEFLRSTAKWGNEGIPPGPGEMEMKADDGKIAIVSPNGDVRWQEKTVIPPPVKTDDDGGNGFFSSVGSWGGWRWILIFLGIGGGGGALVWFLRNFKLS